MSSRDDRLPLSKALAQHLLGAPSRAYQPDPAPIHTVYSNLERCRRQLEEAVKEVARTLSKSPLTQIVAESEGKRKKLTGSVDIRVSADGSIWITGTSEAPSSLEGEEVVEVGEDESAMVEPPSKRAYTHKTMRMAQLRPWAKKLGLDITPYGSARRKIQDLCIAEEARQEAARQEAAEEAVEEIVEDNPEPKKKAKAKPKKTKSKGTNGVKKAPKGLLDGLDTDAPKSDAQPDSLGDDFFADLEEEDTQPTRIIPRTVGGKMGNLLKKSDSIDPKEVLKDSGLSEEQLDDLIRDSGEV